MISTTDLLSTATLEVAALRLNCHQFADDNQIQQKAKMASPVVITLPSHQFLQTQLGNAVCLVKIQPAWKVGCKSSNKLTQRHPWTPVKQNLKAQHAFLTVSQIPIYFLYTDLSRIAP
ncbi:MAG: hypothetical protein SGI77_00185 [Pirellulaceae bacterium]|nr:hypothetical protein [Pirellulaceae bacterium]